MEESKQLEWQTCDKTHRSYRASAKCRFKSAYQDGEGPYATLHYNRMHGYGLLVFLHRTKEKAQEFIDHASTGRESGVLYHSTHNGIWCFTRGWEMDETLRIIMDIKRLKERKEREERGEL